MKSPVKVALVIGLVMEAVNYWVVCVPIDVGLPSGAGWFTNLIAFQWIVLHLPGLRLVNRFQNVNHSLVGAILFLSGYLSTVLVLVVVFWLIEGFRRIARRPSAVSQN